MKNNTHGTNKDDKLRKENNNTLKAVDLQKLGKTELLILMKRQEEENQELRTKNKELEKLIKSRELICSQTGSIAVASVAVSQIFNAAQEAADLYLYNVKSMNPKNFEIINSVEEQAKEIIEQANIEANRMIWQAKKEVDMMRKQQQDKLNKFTDIYAELQRMLKQYEDNENQIFK